MRNIIALNGCHPNTAYLWELCSLSTGLSRGVLKLKMWILCSWLIGQQNQWFQTIRVTVWARGWVNLKKAAWNKTQRQVTSETSSTVRHRSNVLEERSQWTTSGKSTLMDFLIEWVCALEAKEPYAFQNMSKFWRGRTVPRQSSRQLRNSLRYVRSASVFCGTLWSMAVPLRQYLLRGAIWRHKARSAPSEF